MKKKMPSEGLRLGRDSGSILCDTLKKWRFRTGWGGGKSHNAWKNFVPLEKKNWATRYHKACYPVVVAEAGLEHATSRL